MRVANVRAERRPRTLNYFARDGDPRPPWWPGEICEEGGRGAREREKGRAAEEGEGVNPYGWGRLRVAFYPW